MSLSSLGTYMIRIHKDETVAIGDYLQRKGDGTAKKQEDDIMRSKTVAKSTEAINWSEVTSSIQYSGSAYKKHLTAVTFHCG